jgi:phosphohistidine phosphatase
MLIYLVRHAPAGLRDPEQWPDDSDRPLTKSGVRGFRKAARGLRQFVPNVDLVLSSPYVRTWQTAMILHERANWPEPVKLDVLIDSPPEAVLEALKVFVTPQSIALVGHDPNLGRLAAAMISGDWSAKTEFKKGAVACIRVESVEALQGSELLWLLPPRVLRALV